MTRSVMPIVAALALAALALVTAEAPATASAPAPAANRPRSSFNYALSGLDWNGTCETGKRQSPINVVPASNRITTLPQYKSPRLNFGRGKNITVYNTGHTMQIQWVTDVPANATIRLGSFLGQPSATGPVAPLDDPTNFLGDADTRLALNPVQWHVHTPSEHTINGKFSALEAHLVNTIPATGNFSFCPAAGCLAVYGVLYDIVADLEQADPFLSPFLNNMPNKVGLKNGVNLTTPLVFRDFFPVEANNANETHYISYAGSLTTPPCSENVHWTLMTTPRNISIAQLAKLQVALGSTEGNTECYQVREASKVGSTLPSYSANTKELNDSAPIISLCAGQGERTNDRYPQPINNRTIWQFTDAALSA